MGKEERLEGAEGEVELWMVGCFEVLPWPASRSLPAAANWRPLALCCGYLEASADIRRSASATATACRWEGSTFFAPVS